MKSPLVSRVVLARAQKVTALAIAAALTVVVVGAPVVSQAQMPRTRPVPSAADAANEEALKNSILERMGRSEIGAKPVETEGVSIVFPQGHAAPISAVAVDADGRSVISSGFDETVRIWDIASARESRTFTGLRAFGALSVGFVPDSTLAIYGDLEGIKLIDTASGATVRTVSSDSTAFSGQRSLALARDGAGTRRPVSVIDLATGGIVWTLPETDGVRSVGISADGTTAVTHSSRSGARVVLDIWDIASRARRRTVTLEGLRPDLERHVAISPDGELVATQSEGNTVNVYRLADGGLVVRLPETVPRGSCNAKLLVFSPDSKRIGMASVEGDALIWDIGPGKLLRQFEATAVNFTADSGSAVLGGFEGGAPWIVSLDDGSETRFDTGVGSVGQVEILPSGREAVSASNQGPVRLWSLVTGELIRNFACPGGVGSESVSVHPSQPLLAIGCWNGAAVLVDLRTGQQVAELLPVNGKERTSARVAFDHSGERIAVAAYDQLRVLNTADRRVLSSFAMPAAQGSAGNTASVYDAIAPGLMQQVPRRFRKQMEEQQRQQAAQVEEMKLNDVQALAWHPDNRRLAVGGAFSVTLWNALDGTRILDFGAVARQEAAQAVREQGQRSRMGPGSIPPGFAGGGAPDLSAAMGMLGSIQGAAATGATALAFSADGSRLLGKTSAGERVWDAGSGASIREAPARTGSMDDPSQLLGQLLPEGMSESGAIALSADGRTKAFAFGRRIKLTDQASGRALGELAGHTTTVSSLSFSRDGKRLVSGAMDGTVRVWDVVGMRELAALVALGTNDFMAVTPDQYYRASKGRIAGVSFRFEGVVYPFDQFDLRFNRPDLLMTSLGLAAPAEIAAYRTAWEKRVDRVGFKPEDLGSKLGLPQLRMLTDNVPVTTDARRLTLQVQASDATATLSRYRVLVNDVPVHGLAGLPVAGAAASDSRDLDVPLVSGRNKIEVSVVNSHGAESLRRTLYTQSTADFGPRNIYLVTIGVSTYRNAAYNLKYAFKDATDVAVAYRARMEASAAAEGAAAGPAGSVQLLDLSNEKATRSGIRGAREFLAQATQNDLVVVFAAGHGMVDRNQNYYFGTYDIDAQAPEVNGLPYEDLERLFDGIPAMQRLLLLDTCFSGEVDKDPTPGIVTLSKIDTGGAGLVSRRSLDSRRAISVQADTGVPGNAGGDSPAGPGGSATLDPITAAVRFQQDWFADLRQGTGAVVISSASGDEFALEGEQWKNGVFTYALLSGLKDASADLNHDGKVTVSEVQSHVFEQVRKLTQGGQNPTVRRENLDYDFTVY